MNYIKVSRWCFLIIGISALILNYNGVLGITAPLSILGIGGFIISFWKDKKKEQ